MILWHRVDARLSDLLTWVFVGWPLVSDWKSHLALLDDHFRVFNQQGLLFLSPCFMADLLSALKASIGSIGRRPPHHRMPRRRNAATQEMVEIFGSERRRRAITHVNVKPTERALPSASSVNKSRVGRLLGIIKAKKIALQQERKGGRARLPLASFYCVCGAEFEYEWGERVSRTAPFVLSV